MLPQQSPVLQQTSEHCPTQQGGQVDREVCAQPMWSSYRATPLCSRGPAGEAEGLPHRAPRLRDPQAGRTCLQEDAPALPPFPHWPLKDSLHQSWTHLAHGKMGSPESQIPTQRHGKESRLQPNEHCPRPAQRLNTGAGREAETYTASQGVLKLDHCIPGRTRGRARWQAEIRVLEKNGTWLLNSSWLALLQRHT